MRWDGGGMRSQGSRCCDGAESETRGREKWGPGGGRQTQGYSIPTEKLEPFSRANPGPRLPNLRRGCPLDKARVGIDPEVKLHPRLRPAVKMRRQRKIRVPAQAHRAKSGRSDQLDTPIQPFGGSLMRGAVARTVDGIEHFARLGQRHDQRRVAHCPS